VKVIDIYSKRRKRLTAVDDVFQYDHLPDSLRVQIVHILNDSLGSEDDVVHDRGMVKEAYEFVKIALCREYGRFELSEGDRYEDNSPRGQLHRFIVTEEDTDKVLDAVEIAFDLLERAGRQHGFRYSADADANVDDAIRELNVRFKESGAGYRFETRQIVRIDSELVHQEVVKPALALLRAKIYKGAQQEFLEAHEHYRHGATKDALNGCLKALESTMKAIAVKRQWAYDAGATASVLVDLMVSKQLIPTFWTTHFTGIRTMLSAGVPTVRNKMGGHGQGAEVVEVPSHIAAFAIHQTASAIVFLAEADGALPT
jgi:hypothetical protein